MANLQYLLYEAALAVVAIMLLDWFRHSWRGRSYYGLAFVAVPVLQTAFVFVQMMRLKKRTKITEDREPLHETYRTVRNGEEVEVAPEDLTFAELQQVELRLRREASADFADARTLGLYLQDRMKTTGETKH